MNQSNGSDGAEFRHCFGVFSGVTGTDGGFGDVWRKTAAVGEGMEEGR